MEFSSFFDGNLLRLTPIDMEQDAPVYSAWTHDSVFWRGISNDPLRPVSAEQAKKAFEAFEKEVEDRKTFHYHLRPLGDERLIGFARLEYLDWKNGGAYLRLGIVSPADQRRGFGSDALRLLARLAFHELNLHRLTAMCASDNTAAQAFLEKHGFTREVTRREALDRGETRCDLLQYGLLRPEWEGNHAQ